MVEKSTILHNFAKSFTAILLVIRKPKMQYGTSANAIWYTNMVVFEVFPKKQYGRQLQYGTKINGSTTFLQNGTCSYHIFPSVVHT